MVCLPETLHTLLNVRLIFLSTDKLETYIFADFRCSFTSFVYDAIRIHRAYCSRSLLIALKSAKKLVYQTGIVYDVAKFACENYRDNYFLLRVDIFN